MEKAKLTLPIRKRRLPHNIPKASLSMDDLAELDTVATAANECMMTKLVEFDLTFVKGGKIKGLKK